MSPTDVPINSVNDYTWSISGLTTPATSLILQFPSAATLNASATTTVYYSNGSLYPGVYTFSGNTITISLIAADQNSPSITLKTTNIKSPQYSAIL